MIINKRVLAVAAHPDDIEFVMSGTLILLAKAGCEIHYMNVANGCCGSEKHDVETVKTIRLEEAKNAAKYIGAKFHPPLANDLEIFYNKELLAKMGSIIRDVSPNILLIPSPQDYMEDHTNTCRLAVTAAFSRNMPNFPVDPPRAVINKDIVIYHAQPQGNRDAFNKLILANIYIDINKVLKEKCDMLAKHKSQKNWLDHSQGFNAYLDTMMKHGREMGVMSKQFEYAEGWRLHNPLGLCASNSDPMSELLAEYYCPYKQTNDI
jgi:LmbE family N-acetylglucosaminyl deacetylase